MPGSDTGDALDAEDDVDDAASSMEQTELALESEYSLPQWESRSGACGAEAAVTVVAPLSMVRTVLDEGWDWVTTPSMHLVIITEGENRFWNELRDENNVVLNDVFQPSVKLWGLSVCI